MKTKAIRNKHLRAIKKLVNEYCQKEIVGVQNIRSATVVGAVIRTALRTEYAINEANVEVLKAIDNIIKK